MQYTDCFKPNQSHACLWLCSGYAEFVLTSTQLVLMYWGTIGVASLIPLVTSQFYVRYQDTCTLIRVESLGTPLLYHKDHSRIQETIPKYKQTTLHSILGVLREANCCSITWHESHPPITSWWCEGVISKWYRVLIREDAGDNCQEAYSTSRRADKCKPRIRTWDSVWINTLYIST